MQNKDSNIYRHLLEIVKKTGEKIVIINPDTDGAVIVMPLKDYEKLRHVENNVPARQVDNKNFSYWAESELLTSEPRESLDKNMVFKGDISKGVDKPENNGKINAIRQPDNKGPKIINNSDFNEDAGEGYYFEPIDEEEKN